MGIVQIKESNNETTFSVQPTQYEVTDLGIEKVIKMDPDGTYISKVVIPKDIFIAAYEKYIIKEQHRG